MPTIRLGHDLRVSPFVILQDFVRRELYCVKCKKHEFFELPLDMHDLARQAFSHTMIYVETFEKTPCSR